MLSKVGSTSSSSYGYPRENPTMADKTDGPEPGYHNNHSAGGLVLRKATAARKVGTLRHAMCSPHKG